MRTSCWRLSRLSPKRAANINPATGAADLLGEMAKPSYDMQIKVCARGAPPSLA